MTSRETLDCRIYMAEDAMHQEADDLGCRLSGVESDLRGLAEEVHRMLFDADRTPLQVRAQAEKVASFKGRIEGFEREIAEVRAAQASPTSAPHDLALVAIAG
jgi:hypothetical protein